MHFHSSLQLLIMSKVYSNISVTVPQMWVNFTTPGIWLNACMCHCVQYFVHHMFFTKTLHGIIMFFVLGRYSIKLESCPQCTAFSESQVVWYWLATRCSNISAENHWDRHNWYRETVASYVGLLDETMLLTHSHPGKFWSMHWKLQQLVKAG